MRPSILSVFFLSCTLFQSVSAQPGAPDTTFSDNGRVSSLIGTGDDYGYDVVIQPDGKIVVAAQASVDNFSFSLLRYNSDGTLDDSFNGDGRVTTNLSEIFSGANAVALQNDGKIVGVGFSINSMGYYDFAVLRYLSNGNLDSTFGNNGVVISTLGTTATWALDVVVQNDGKIIA